MANPQEALYIGLAVLLRQVLKPLPLIRRQTQPSSNLQSIRNRTETPYTDIFSPPSGAYLPTPAMRLLTRGWDDACEERTSGGGLILAPLGASPAAAGDATVDAIGRCVGLIDAEAPKFSWKGKLNTQETGVVS